MCLGSRRRNLRIAALLETNNRCTISLLKPSCLADPKESHRARLMSEALGLAAKLTVYDEVLSRGEKSR